MHYEASHTHTNLTHWIQEDSYLHLFRPYKSQDMFFQTSHNIEYTFQHFGMNISVLHALYVELIVTVEWVMLLLHILGVPDNTLSSETSYPDPRSQMIVLISSREIPG